MTTPTTTMPPRHLSNIDLSNFTIAQGFELYGANSKCYSGWSVSGAGDVNGDGYGDVIVGAPFSSPSGRSYAGTSYVIFGKSSGFNNIDLENLTLEQGFVIYGTNSNDNSGWSVSGAGDINGDNFDDIIIGAMWASPNGRKSAGTSYVIFGKYSSFNNIDLANLTLEQGFVIYGANSNDNSGWSVSEVGDVNGDGYDDIIIGALSPNHGKGASYIIFGNNNPTDINLITLTITQGIVINGARGDYSGASVSKAGDLNGDNFDDVIIGAPGCYSMADNCQGDDTDGKSYIIFGGSDMNNIDLANLKTKEGIILQGSSSALGIAVSEAGDFNKDGYSDVIIGAINANTGYIEYAGSCYIIYGNKTLENMDINNLSSQKGISISGYDYYQYLGQSVGSAGDLNGDGYPDVFALSIYKNSVDDSQAYIIYGGKSGFDVSILEPSASPTTVKTKDPTSTPAPFSSFAPTIYPSLIPSVPSVIPTAIPPTADPSHNPTVAPTELPLFIPTANPSIEPSFQTTMFPTAKPTPTPSCKPSLTPTIESSLLPTVFPTFDLSQVPAAAPTTSPTILLTAIPTAKQTLLPSDDPTVSPTHLPTLAPTVVPTSMPTQSIEITTGGIHNGTSLSENFIISSSTDVIISGGGGTDTYTPEPNANVLITVTDFNKDFDTINLKSFNIYNFDEVNITSGSIIITLEDNQKMRLLQLTPGDINSDNFIFNTAPSPSPTAYLEDTHHDSNTDDSLIIGISVAVSIVGVLSCAAGLWYSRCLSGASHKVDVIDALNV